MKILTAIFLFVSLFSAQVLNAQGCSDAGVCTLHSFLKNIGEKQVTESKKNEVASGISYGKGEKSTDNLSLYVEYTRKLTKKLEITGKINYAVINGELGKTKGPGDIFLSVSNTFYTKGKWQKSILAGLKIPLNNGNKILSNTALPMPYQTSLGTTDLLLGINLSHKLFSATLAFQQPINSTNDNTFLPGDYSSGSPAKGYIPTNKLSRKADVVSRLSYFVQAGQKFSFRPGLLAIYHIANDTYLDDDKIRKPITDSKGITLNANIFITYELNKTNKLVLVLASPLAVRKQRPDGLTRKFVVGLEYRVNF